MPKFLNTVLARDTTDCTGANTGGLQVAGGAYVAKRFRADGQTLFNDNTASTSTTSGAVTIPNGGLGVGGAVYATSFNGSGAGLTSIPPAALLAGGSDGQLLAKNGTSWSWTSPLSNPMTTSGDLIVGGSGGAPARLAKGADGQILKMVAGNVAWQDNTAGQAQEDVLGVVVDGGGVAITTGSKGYREVPYNCTITGWTILGKESGSCVVDVRRATYAAFPTTSSIAGSEKPTLSSAQKNQDTALSTWTTSLTAGDILEFNVESAATVTRIMLSLKIQRT